MSGEVEVIRFHLAQRAVHSQEIEFFGERAGAAKVGAQEGHRDASALKNVRPGFDQLLTRMPDLRQR